MRLEEEIKQKKFSSEKHKLILNIRYTASWLYLRSVQSLKPFDISPEQYNVLRILRGQHPQPSSIQLIIERMLDKSSNASRIVEKLRIKELVDRKECPSDRRLVDVLITTKGLELLDQLDPIVSQWPTLCKDMTEEEAKVINDHLDHMRTLEE